MCKHLGPVQVRHSKYPLLVLYLWPLTHVCIVIWRHWPWLDTELGASWYKIGNASFSLTLINVGKHLCDMIIVLTVFCCCCFPFVLYSTFTVVLFFSFPHSFYIYIMILCTDLSMLVSVFRRRSRCLAVNWRTMMQSMQRCARIKLPPTTTIILWVIPVCSCLSVGQSVCPAITYCEQYLCLLMPVCLSAYLSNYHILWVTPLSDRACLSVQSSHHWHCLFMPVFLSNHHTIVRSCLSFCPTITYRD